VIGLNKNEEMFTEYQYGFHDRDVSIFKTEKGLTKEIVETISKRKQEPQWMLEFRLNALKEFYRMPMPTWGGDLSEIDFEDLTYYVKPSEKTERSWDEVPEEIKNTFEKLGIPEAEQKYLAGVSAQYESEVVYHNMHKQFEEQGIIFEDTDTALKNHEEIFKQYFSKAVDFNDNKFAALNSAVWSGGSFIYCPKNVSIEAPLQAYFRINSEKMGQFERTLIIIEENSSLHYVEGCTAPTYSASSLHAAVVEIVAEEGAEVKYSTVQNWYPGDAQGKGGIYNFVTKRGICKGNKSKISWTQVETGSAITWKYPSCILAGENSVAEFYSVAVTNHYQQADTGTKMIHLAPGTRSTIVSKGISAGKSDNSYRGLVKVSSKAENARNFSQCDSLLLGDKCGAHTFPEIDVKNSSAVVEHEATTSKIGEDQIFYCNQRGIKTEEAIGLIVNGYAREVLNKLPMEFAVEAQKLLMISLEGSVG